MEPTPKKTLLEHIEEAKRLDRQIVIVEDVTNGEDPMVKSLSKLHKEGSIYLVNLNELTAEEREQLINAQKESVGHSIPDIVDQMKNMKIPDMPDVSINIKKDWHDGLPGTKKRF